MTEWRKATEADLDLLVAEAVDLADGFYGDRPVDWEDLFDRVEQYTHLELPNQTDDPLFGKIKRRVRKIRSEG